MIFKIQKPVVTNADPMECLIYNEDRSIMDQMPLEQQTIDELFDDNVFKVYWEGEVAEDGTVLLMKQVEEQSW